MYKTKLLFFSHYSAHIHWRILIVSLDFFLGNIEIFGKQKLIHCFLWELSLNVNCLSRRRLQDELSCFLIRDGSLEEAVSLQRSAAEAKVVLYGDPSEEAAASYQMLGSIRLKQGRTEQALKWLTKVINPKKAFYFSPTFFLTSYFLKVTFNISPPPPNPSDKSQTHAILPNIQSKTRRFFTSSPRYCIHFSFTSQNTWTKLALHVVHSVLGAAWQP